MKILSSTLRRAAGPALVAGLVVVSYATPAAAQAPGSGVFRFGGLVGLQARAGAQNQVKADVSGGRLILSDGAGIAVSLGCTPLSNTSADCGSLVGVTRLAIQ